MTSIHIKTQTRIHTQQKRGFYWFGLGEQPGHSFYVLILRLGKPSVATEFLLYVPAVSHTLVV
jgi:hypothetical protein